MNKDEGMCIIAAAHDWGDLEVECTYYCSETLILFMMIIIACMLTLRLELAEAAARAHRQGSASKDP